MVNQIKIRHKLVKILLQLLIKRKIKLIKIILQQIIPIMLATRTTLVLQILIPLMLIKTLKTK